jgi:adenylate kinase
VFGISGVGKTSLITKALGCVPDCLHLQASTLIKRGFGDPALESEALRRSSGDRVLANQEILVTSFKSALAAQNPEIVIFDGHLIIDNDLELVEVPVEVIAALQPSRLIHVDDDVDVIARRRESDRNRQRPSRSLEELAHHQALSIDLCRRYASSLGVPLDTLAPDDAARLAEIVRPQ